MSLPKALPSLEWVWGEMDRVWHELGLRNDRPLAGQSIAEFYGHPVWLMNGIFTAVDPISASQRDAIAGYIDRVGARSVADYGDGFGELAQAIRRAVPQANISLPSTFHLRHTFPMVMGAYGLRYLGTVDGASYAQVFERLNRLRSKRAEQVSRLIGPTINLARSPMGYLKRRMVR